MEGNSYKVCKELCERCRFRSEDYIFSFYRCDYALATEKCRLDPPGICTHFIEDEKYDEKEVWRKREERRIKLQKYKDEHKPEYTRPVGRPKKQREW